MHLNINLTSDNKAFVESIYSTVLNKNAKDDTDGKAYWIKALDGGGDITSSDGKTISVGALTKSELIAAMIENLASNDANPVDKATFNAKVKVSDYIVDNSIAKGEPNEAAIIKF